jgi:hypothetical protein
MPAPNLTSLFVQDAERMTGKLDSTGRLKGKFTALVTKDWIPDGAGFNWQSVQIERTAPGSAPTWQRVIANAGATNTCVPAATRVNSATTVQDYYAEVTALDSEDICLNDARYSYSFKEQVMMKRENFVNNIFDVWDERDRYMYQRLGKYKYVANDALDRTVGSTDFPLTVPTNIPSLDLLRAFHIKLVQDGADKKHGAYGMRNGIPIFLAIMDSESIGHIIKSERENINYAYMGSKERSPLLDAWGIERDYAGFYLVADDKMPRYNFDGDWVEVPYYADGTATVGTSAEVNPDYESAEFTDIIFFNKMVMTREMPKPMSTVGADTKFRAMDYNGEVIWLNIPDKTNNPIQSVGNWYAILQAAYRPRLTRYGYSVRVSRCTGQLYQFTACEPTG